MELLEQITLTASRLQKGLCQGAKVWKIVVLIARFFHTPFVVRCTARFIWHFLGWKTNMCNATKQDVTFYYETQFPLFEVS